MGRMNSGNGIMTRPENEDIKYIAPDAGYLDSGQRQPE
jgi:hypothetical protein